MGMGIALSRRQGSLQEGGVGLGRGFDFAGNDLLGRPEARPPRRIRGGTRADLRDSYRKRMIRGFDAGLVFERRAFAFEQRAYQQ